jgi:putative ABC transport system substrate-binding protein
MSDMNRREFITLLGSAAAWPLTARAQQPDGMRRIGVLITLAESDTVGQAYVAAFRDGLQKLGWTEGRTFRIDTRRATPDVESIQRFAKELVALQPDLILTQNTPCPFRKLYPDVMVVQPRQDWDGYNDPGPLNCPT